MIFKNRFLYESKIRLNKNSIRNDGIISMLINNSVNLSFCLPHLAYKISEKCEQTYFVEIIFDAIKYLRYELENQIK